MKKVILIFILCVTFLLTACGKNPIAERLKLAETGDYIRFGTYEGEAIEWLVLEKTDEKMLVISRYALEDRPYHDTYEDITWEDCTLRKWLNDDFLNAAFTKEERAMIPTVTVPADKNPEYDTDPGNATRDKVFLLSIAEAEKYFDSAAEMYCNYRPSKGGTICMWWLRSPGGWQDFAACVIPGFDFDFFELGHGVYNSDSAAVRPALWIEVDT